MRDGGGGVKEEERGGWKREEEEEGEVQKGPVFKVLSVKKEVGNLAE